jgi:elongin-A
MAPAAAERPSLLELCIRTACENVAHIGDVGSLPTQFVSRILQSCSGADQLRHIEVCSKKLDLSQVTDGLWRRWFANDFGTTCAEYIIHTGERLGPANPTPKWRRLYDEKHIRSQSNWRPPPPPPVELGKKRRRNSKDKNLVVEELRISSMRRSPPAAAAAGGSSSSSKRQRRMGKMVTEATAKYKRRQERLRKATAKRARVRARG